ncbi:structure-specific endonuclease subunit SLX1 [Lophiotrema nucula]|uniref:Structure-specific endonuclease subunit SLX1 n=1 Tax=Lophiotrema nucula TaxID=690887 RepID=A0A6A5Z2J8_9PLEO|nr:structure-specific endonuclease subunit SLX1 [Lophiotrema nucula]
MADKPVPAFYCCYLLRSRHRKSYYIGSTPNPARRLAQHNGDSKGGAKRTSMQGKRPWEMTCVVTGFPSKYAALQFEWAWQNTHATRHIERDIRDARLGDLQKKRKANASPRKRNSRPPMSLEARLKNLHHLLGVSSFNRWPLNIRFFSPAVFKVWDACLAKQATPIRSSIVIRLTPSDPPAAITDPATGKERYSIPEAIRSIPVGYEDFKLYLEKSRSILEETSSHTCEMCKQKINMESAIALVCPHESCRSVSHINCLAHKFLGEEGDREALIPVEGTCPGCRRPVKWSTMVTEESLRSRGEKEIDALFKPRRRKKANSVSESEAVETLDADMEDEELDETWMEDSTQLNTNRFDNSPYSHSGINITR